MKDQNEQLISIVEAAKILNVSTDTLRKWDKEGKLKSIRFTPNGRRKYSKEEIEKFIEKGQQK